MSSFELKDQIVSALEDLKEQEVLLATNNALKIRAWLYLFRFLNSFNTTYDKKNAYSSIELTSEQASLFAFGLDDNNNENFLLFCQEADFWWMNEITIENVIFIDQYLILKFPPLNYENLNIKSDNKITIKSLTVSIPLSSMYYDHLKSFISGFKRMYLGNIRRNIGFKKLEIIEYSDRPIPILKESTISTKAFFKNNSHII